MTGIVSQLITLVAFGNEYLATGEIPANFYPENSAFQYCNSVQFTTLKEIKRLFSKPLIKEIVFAEDPVQWLHLIKRDGCQRLVLCFQNSKDQSRAKDYMLAGVVGGGGTWRIEACYDNYSNYWAEKWEVTKQKAPDNNIWGVKYGRVAKQAPKTYMQFGLIETREALKQSLTAIHDFASKHRLNTWQQIFDKAISTLNDPNPTPTYYQDIIISKNYSLDARQLLFAAANAWVFGGMGSWNDLGFDDEDENKKYADLSENLYKMIIQSIIAVLNSKTL